jgi:hypothetical protein
MSFTFEHSLFDSDLLLIAGISFGTSAVMIFSWFAFGKKIPQNDKCDKKSSSNNSINVNLRVKDCECLPIQCKCKKRSVLESCKLMHKRFKIFLLRPVQNRIPFFIMILQPLIIRIKMAFKNKIVSQQTKAEASLHKLARSLWDQGKYAEAERINLEVLNVRRLVFGDKK